MGSLSIGRCSSAVTPGVKRGDGWGGSTLTAARGMLRRMRELSGRRGDTAPHRLRPGGAVEDGAMRSATVQPCHRLGSFPPSTSTNSLKSADQVGSFGLDAAWARSAIAPESCPRGLGSFGLDAARVGPPGHAAHPGAWVRLASRGRALLEGCRSVHRQDGIADYGSWLGSFGMARARRVMAHAAFLASGPRARATRRLAGDSVLAVAPAHADVLGGRAVREGSRSCGSNHSLAWCRN